MRICRRDFLAQAQPINPSHGAKVSAGGMQEVDITVKGGYQPSAVIAKAGRPLRLNFTGRESTPCGEEVVLPEFGRRAHLPEDRTRRVFPLRLCILA